MTHDTDVTDGPEQGKLRPYGQDLTVFLPSVRVTPAMKSRVEARALADGVTVADLVRTALMEWLDTGDIAMRNAMLLARVELHDTHCASRWYDPCDCRASKNNASLFSETP